MMRDYQPTVQVIWVMDTQKALSHSAIYPYGAITLVPVKFMQIKEEREGGGKEWEGRGRNEKESKPETNEIGYL